MARVCRVFVRFAQQGATTLPIPVAFVSILCYDPIGVIKRIPLRTVPSNFGGQYSGRRLHAKPDGVVGD